MLGAFRAVRRGQAKSNFAAFVPGWILKRPAPTWGDDDAPPLMSTAILRLIPLLFFRPPLDGLAGGVAG